MSFTGRYRSKEDDVAKISVNVFVTNFPENCSAKDLFYHCKQYGHVVDSFIPTKRSKAGKRFGFVRFINVFNNERLVNNLSTVWIGRNKLQAHLARFARPPSKGGSQVPSKTTNAAGTNKHFVNTEKDNARPSGTSFVSVLQGNDHLRHNIAPSPTLVLDDPCVVDRDYGNFVIGDKEVEYCSDDDSLNGEEVLKSVDCNTPNAESDSDNDVVSETCFGESGGLSQGDAAIEQPVKDIEQSNDPFGIYDLLGKKDAGVGSSEVEKTPPFPPGFTPSAKADSMERGSRGKVNSINRSVGSRVVKDAHNIGVDLGSSGRGPVCSQNKGGSMLDLLDDIIKIEKTMGYSMEGCERDIEGIIGALLYVWDSSVFSIDNHIISDNFLAIYGTWIPTKTNLLVVSVYAPQALSKKRLLWDYISLLINRWAGDCIVMGDFNEVRCKEECMGSMFNVRGASGFNDFIADSSLIDVRLERYSYTWSHPSASKMSRLDRFLVSDGLTSIFPNMSAICLDRHLSDQRPILLRDVVIDYGATPFRFYHSWLSWSGFDQFIISTWNSFSLEDNNGMVRFKKKLQLLKKEIREWVMNRKRQNMGRINEIKADLIDIDNTRELVQKAKVQWAVEGDENSKFFHGILNKKRATLSIRGIMLDIVWVVDPTRVKEIFRTYFASRFNDPSDTNCKINYNFPNCLLPDQASDLECQVSNDEIRQAVWGCGEDKSPRPDGFTGCNSSFVSLIPKTLDPKFISDYRPISLIGCLYKVVTKILATRLSMVISGLISDVQTAFVPNRQILDGPFILNELLDWCKRHKHKAMVFKVDFAKAYDSIHWDYLLDVLRSFGFGEKWCSWIKGCLHLSMASVLVNGSPTAEFQIFRGLKQGDPLAPYRFILVMESLHFSFSRVVDFGMFNGITIDNTVTLSHLFYADDAFFIGEWSDDNLNWIL
uniref:RNA-directed DNA polymerase, eukaryota n=1 Tax=Tanacetum cinerariifolium TaxID=118510 RepID=A0A699IL99_TANCI|nr:hypothetical protein [Tanacetum cinerariifolium]